MPLGAKASFDLPHRRGSHLLDTPALIDHFTYWHGPRSKENAEKEESLARGEIPASLKALGFETGEDAVLQWRDEDHNYDGHWHVDHRDIVCAYINQFIRKSDISVRNSVLYKEPPHFTNNYDLCCKVDDEIRACNFDVSPKIYHNRTLSIPAEIDGVSFDIIIDIHNEYFTIKFRAYPLYGKQCQELNHSYNSFRRTKCNFKRAAMALAFLSKAETKEFFQRQGGDLTNDRVSKFAETAYNCVYVEFWDHLYAKLGLSRGPSECDSLKEVSEYTASFRGTVLRSLSLEKQTSCFLGTPPAALELAEQAIHRTMNLPRPSTDRNTIVRPIPGRETELLIPMQDEHHVAKRKVRNERAKPDKSKEPEIFDSSNKNYQERNALVELVNHHTPFFGRLFGFADGSVSVQQIRTTNSVLCSFLDGLVVYGSDMGSHIAGTAASQTHRRSQIRFFMYYAGGSRDQLGRTLRKLLCCGELRTIPLLEFTKIRGAGKRITRIIASYRQKESALTSENATSIREDVRKEDERLAKEREQGFGGLSTRLARNLLYFRLLKRWMKGIRCDRIEGWQPYDVFINDRVAPPFMTMEAMQAEVDRVDEVRQSIENKFITLDISRNTDEIAGTLKEIQKLQKSIKNSPLK